eukprot:383928_1
MNYDPGQALFVACCFSILFGAAFSLIIITFCWVNFNYSDKTPKQKINISKKIENPHNWSTSTPQDLFQQLQALQILIQQEVAHNSINNNALIQYSNESSINLQHMQNTDEFIPTNINNQRKFINSNASINSINYPYNHRIQHQLNSIGSNCQTEIILLGTDSQRTAVQIDTNTFKEFLSWKAQKSIQSIYNHTSVSRDDLEVECDTDQGYINDMVSNDEGSSESLFVTMPQTRATVFHKSHILEESKKKNKISCKIHSGKNRSHFTFAQNREGN